MIIPWISVNEAAQQAKKMMLLISHSSAFPRHTCWFIIPAQSCGTILKDNFSYCKYGSYFLVVRITKGIHQVTWVGLILLGGKSETTDFNSSKKAESVRHMFVFPNVFGRTEGFSVTILLIRFVNALCQLNVMSLNTKLLPCCLHLFQLCLVTLPYPFPV